MKTLSYQQDIEKLNILKEIYETTENLNGAFYSDMIAEIDLQIKHCEDCIKNLEQHHIDMIAGLEETIATLQSLK